MEPYSGRNKDYELNKNNMTGIILMFIGVGVLIVISAIVKILSFYIVENDSQEFADIVTNKDDKSMRKHWYVNPEWD